MIEHEPLLNRLLLGADVIGPYRELDASAFPSNPAEAVHNRAFRDSVRLMLTTSLDRTLPVMLRPQGMSRRSGIRFADKDMRQS